MKNPYEILPYHEQLHDCSCIAWGLELILKMHEKIPLTDYPLQNGINPTGWGFGDDAQKMLASYGIQSKESSLEFTDFEALMSEQVKSGSFPVFSVPSGVHVDYANNSATIMHHAWVVVSTNPFECRSRSYQNPDLLPPLPLAAVYQAVRAKLQPDYRIHILLHQ